MGAGRCLCCPVPGGLGDPVAARSDDHFRSRFSRPAGVFFWRCLSHGLDRERGLRTRGGFPAPGCSERGRFVAVHAVVRFWSSLVMLPRRAGTPWVWVQRSGSQACWRLAPWVSPGPWHGRTPRVGVTTRNGGACRSSYLRKGRDSDGWGSFGISRSDRPAVERSFGGKVRRLAWPAQP